MRRLVLTFAASAIVASLEGCASSAVPPEAQVQQERLRSWQKLCEDRGFTRGTTDFDVCVMGYDREAVNPPIR
jgi:hypothetical protein